MIGTGPTARGSPPSEPQSAFALRTVPALEEEMEANGVAGTSRFVFASKRLFRSALVIRSREAIRRGVGLASLLAQDFGRGFLGGLRIFSRAAVPGNQTG
jgi:hypothetical protein